MKSKMKTIFRSGLGNKVLGSLCSVTVGWLVCVLGWMVGVGFYAWFSNQPSANLVEALMSCGFYVGAICGAFVLAAWFTVFVWIYLFVPRSCRLWWWPVTTTLGVLAGVLILVIPTVIITGRMDFSAWPFVVSAGVTGGVTCLFASLTAPRFHGK